MNLLIMLVVLAQVPDNDLPDSFLMNRLTTETPKQEQPISPSTIKAIVDQVLHPEMIIPPVAVAPAVTVPPVLNGMRAKYRVMIGGKPYEVLGRKDESGMIYYQYSENPHIPRPAVKAAPKSVPRTSARRMGSCPVCGGGCPSINKCGRGLHCPCGAC